MRTTVKAAGYLVICALLSQLGECAFGQAAPAEDFDAEISGHFLKSAKPSYAKRRAKKANKPLLVLLTKRGCGACQNLKQALNNGGKPGPGGAPGSATTAKSLLAGFVVVHAKDAEMAAWQAPGQHYAPQAYFYAPGEEQPLPIEGSSTKSPRFFHDEATLVWGMQKALEVVKTGERSNGKGKGEL